ncbi:MAG: carbohydrate kinase [Cyclobacteriaceae bacterium]|nr:carbohydrate kinase [Cyclobacteriaceae bacterium]
MKRYLLGLDIGSSSVKAALVDCDSGKTLDTVQSPADEMAIQARHPGWAEQDPGRWWHHVVEAIHLLLRRSGVDAGAIQSVGIAYQMHGLVCLDKNKEVVRPAIIWCDSRAARVGARAFRELGPDYCLKNFLNSPGNFTLSKLRWVRENEPATYARIAHVLLPGDYIAFRLTGELFTTTTGLSEAVCWNFSKKKPASELLRHYEIDPALLPPLVPVFEVQGAVTTAAAAATGLKAGTPIAYRAGDQPNNAFSLNVLNPGETAATAGTSGVIYSVTDKNAFDPKSRVNTFVHVNNQKGVLLCINGTGILNSWLRRNLGTGSGTYTYEEINRHAAGVSAGADGLCFYPFGNGSERIFENRLTNARLEGLDFNRHNQAHMLRAAQEGIVFGLYYGFEILREMGVSTTTVKAGYANMFLSPVFREAFVNTLNVPLELYETSGATGAAIGAGVGSGYYKSTREAFMGLNKLHSEIPNRALFDQYASAYAHWRKGLRTR